MLVKKQKLLFSSLPLLIIGLTTALLMVSFFVGIRAYVAQGQGNDTPVGAYDYSDVPGIKGLQEKINYAKDRIDALSNKSGAYKKEITDLQEESATLAGQVSILDNRVAKFQIDIELQEEKITKTKLEMQTTEEKIAETENRIVKRKGEIKELLQHINQLDQRTYLEILLENNRFSEFFNQLKQVQDVQGSLQETLGEIEQYQVALLDQQTELAHQQELQRELLQALENRKADLKEEKEAKQVLMNETRNSEIKYRNLLWGIQQQQKIADQEIASSEKRIRDLIAQSQRDQELSRFNDLSSDLAWPVDPLRGITAYFHDPTYPFKKLFEHSAIDIRASQGTPIRAAASGYVGSAKDNGLGYSYIMVIHNNGISTVYGHVSRIDVKEDDFVMQGQSIGATGGLPGTRGAGNFSTGAHLHFEVRNNGIPVNPLEYLP